MAKHYVYCARLTKQGGPVVDLVEVEPEALPDGVATFTSKGAAKAAWKDKQREKDTRV